MNPLKDIKSSTYCVTFNSSAYSSEYNGVSFNSMTVSIFLSVCAPTQVSFVSHSNVAISLLNICVG